MTVDRGQANETSDKAPRRLLLSIHDVSPRFEAAIDRLHDLLTAAGAQRIAMLVVPDFWREAPIRPGSPFATRLRDWAAAGTEMFLHGAVHRDETEHRSAITRLKGRHLTAGEGEFLGLDAATAGERIAAGRALIEDICGRPIAGFVAPAWLYGPGAHQAMAAQGIALAEDHWRVWRPIDGKVLARSPVITWATRTPARERSSLAVAALARRLRGPRVMRAAVHPGDCRSDAVCGSIAATVAALARRRVGSAYADLVRDAARRRAPSRHRPCLRHHREPIVSNSIALAAPFDPALLSGPAVAAGPDWRDRVAGWAGAGLSVVVLGFVAHALGTGGLDGLFAHASASPAFWAVFIVAYLASPACEWVIFHRLWQLPRAGMLALLRKEVSNELLFGYSGEAQFYLWARRHVPMTGSPFGAVKDVAVLSALAGNIATLAMMAVTAPTLATLAALPGAKAFGGSVAIVIAISLALFLLRRAVFSLPVPALRMVLAVHGVRIVLHVGLTALMWHLLLPAVPLASWMLLATLRLMISRLPLVANKDLLFAGMALLLLGPAGGVTAVVATVSGLIVAAHLVVALLVYSLQLAPRLVRG